MEKCANLLELDKCCKMNTYSQKSYSTAENKPLRILHKISKFSRKIHYRSETRIFSGKQCIRCARRPAGAGRGGAAAPRGAGHRRGGLRRAALLDRRLRGQPPHRDLQPVRVGARGAGCGDRKDWIELFIRNEKILSPLADSEFSQNFHNSNLFAFFLKLSTNFDIFAHICEFFFFRAKLQ